MEISVKVVVFQHKKTAAQGNLWSKKYGSYCPELRYFFHSDSENEIIDNLKRHLYQELCHRFRYDNLKNRGWEITENSIKIPTFADEEYFQMTGKIYPTIVEPKIIVVNVEVPEPRNLW